MIKKKMYKWVGGIFYGVYSIYCRYRYGQSVRIIPLTHLKFAIVDAEDYERLTTYKWQARRYTTGWYAGRRTRASEGNGRKMVWMHKVVLEPPAGKLIDHRNNNGLDNRQTNLRIATFAENACNRRKTKAGCTSRYKGVTFYKEPHRHKRWGAEITKNGRRIRLGRYKKEIEAARAYDEAAKRYHGEFASLNFPEPQITQIPRIF